MVTLAIDDVLTDAQLIRDLMTEIDPEGSHYAGSDAAEMQKLAIEVKPDVIWLDVEMKGRSGLEMAAEIGKVLPDSNLVFVTDRAEYAVEAFSLHVSGFVIKPVTKERIREEIAHLRKPIKSLENSALLRVQCFGNFEAFGRDGRLKFKRSLSKEALAYLVDRRGAGCTVGEICSVLWEDKQTDKGLKSQCRVIMAALKKDLTEAGAGDVLVKGWNTWGIDTSKISCDYYDFLNNDSAAVNSFRGEYMAQYSWAEMTVGSLFDISAESQEA